MQAATTKMSAVQVVKEAYAAFGRGDIAAIVALADDTIDWRFHGAKRLPYTGKFARRDIGQWFADVDASDEVQAFEPREFIDGGDHVTVLGWERCAARPSGKVFECAWVHVFTVKNDKITRFWGIYDTEASAAAR